MSSDKPVTPSGTGDDGPDRRTSAAGRGDKPVTPSGTGDGTVPHVSPLAFWSAIIPLLATSIILPCWQMWISSQHEAARQSDAQKVLTGQAETQAKQDVTHEEIKQVKQLAVEALPPQTAKPAE
jgi:hypothetical protein